MYPRDLQHKATQSDRKVTLEYIESDCLRLMPIPDKDSFDMFNRPVCLSLPTYMEVAAITMRLCVHGCSRVAATALALTSTRLKSELIHLLERIATEFQTTQKKTQMTESIVEIFEWEREQLIEHLDAKIQRTIEKAKMQIVHNEIDYPVDCCLLECERLQNIVLQGGVRVLNAKKMKKKKKKETDAEQAVNNYIANKQIIDYIMEFRKLERKQLIEQLDAKIQRLIDKAKMQFSIYDIGYPGDLYLLECERLQSIVFQGCVKVMYAESKNEAHAEQVANNYIANKQIVYSIVKILNLERKQSTDQVEKTIDNTKKQIAIDEIAYPVDLISYECEQLQSIVLQGGVRLLSAELKNITAVEQVVNNYISNKIKHYDKLMMDEQTIIGAKSRFVDSAWAKLARNRMQFENQLEIG
ncbi:hypothetical protein PENTCL1PPCAC_20973, partial [Pristionchus entomophagus]